MMVSGLIVRREPQLYNLIITLLYLLYFIFLLEQVSSAMKLQFQSRKVKLHSIRKPASRLIPATRDLKTMTHPVFRSSSKPSPRIIILVQIPVDHHYFLASRLEQSTLFWYLYVLLCPAATLKPLFQLYINYLTVYKFHYDHAVQLLHSALLQLNCRFMF